MILSFFTWRVSVNWASLLLGYTVNSATVPGDVLYIAGQPRYNHTGQVVIYRMEGDGIKVLQTLSGEQVHLENVVLNSFFHSLNTFTVCRCKLFQKALSLYSVC